jgi:ferrous iron transport protein B
MTEARNRDGSKVFALSSVLGLIAFFIRALQCTATAAMAAREAGSWNFAIIQLIAMNLLAYGAACAVVQGL